MGEQGLTPTGMSVESQAIMGAGCGLSPGDSPTARSAYTVQIDER